MLAARTQVGERQKRKYAMSWKRVAPAVLLVSMVLGALITLSGCLFRVRPAVVEVGVHDDGGGGGHHDNGRGNGDRGNH